MVQILSLECSVGIQCANGLRVQSVWPSRLICGLVAMAAELRFYVVRLVLEKPPAVDRGRGIRLDVALSFRASVR